MAVGLSSRVSRQPGLRLRPPEALADHLAWLIDHPEVWPEFGRRGRRHVEEHFDMRRLNERLVGIYEDVVAGRLLSHD